MTKPIWFGGETTLDFNPKDMLDELSSQDDIEHCVAVVSRKDGTLTFHSSTNDVAKSTFWLQRILHDAYAGGFTDDE